MLRVSCGAERRAAQSSLQELSQQAGSLPQRTGRAYKRFKLTHADVLERAQTRTIPAPQARGKREYDVKVYSQVQPEVDLDGLACAVVMLARQIQEEAQQD